MTQSGRLGNYKLYIEVVGQIGIMLAYFLVGLLGAVRGI